jgi:solute carrier family 25 (mitochondrial phosphate transporter), member 3
MSSQHSSPLVWTHSAPSSTTAIYYHPPLPAGPHDTRYYVSCYFAGGLSSSIRWVLSPLELIKTRLQTAPSLMASSSVKHTMMGTLVHIYSNEGPTGLFRGLGPTAAAYWLQTSTKYSLYEFLKDRWTAEEGSHLPRGLVYVAAAATAEALADVLMCPFEMLKARMQGASASTSFPQRMGPALREMLRHRHVYQFPFGSLGPVWGRQIPGTVVNFYTFENAVSFIYARLGDRPKSEYTATQQLGVTVLAGYVAGAGCAMVSHPADSIISLQSLPEYRGQSVLQIIQRVGWYRLATKGLAPRILMTGQIIAFQWLLYDSIKSGMGYGTSGGGK